MQGCTHVYVLYILVGIRTQCLEHVFTLKEKDITYHTRCGLHMYALCPFQYIYKYFVSHITLYDEDTHGRKEENIYLFLPQHLFFT